MYEHRSFNTVFETDKLSLAAYLLSRGHNPLAIIPTSPTRCVFRYDRTDSFVSDLRDFSSGLSTAYAIYELHRSDLAQRMKDAKVAAGYRSR